MDTTAPTTAYSFTPGELASQFDHTYQTQLRVRLLAKANGDQIQYDSPFTEGSDPDQVARLGDELAATHADEFSAARELIGRGHYETVDTLDFIRDRCIPPPVEEANGMRRVIAAAAAGGAFLGAVVASVISHFI